MMFRTRMLRTTLALVAALATGLAGSAQAAPVEIHMAQQYGLSYLNLMIMQDQHLIEKHAKQKGLGDVKVTWVKFGGVTPMTDSLLSGTIDFAAGGAPSMIRLWDKTHNSPNWVKGVASLNSMPLYLVTNNPKIHSLKDFTDKDQIALPSVKVSNQAVYLQMAVAKTFGMQNYQKLDARTVAMAHPEATVALLSGKGPDAHYSSPPFQYQELAHPGIHKVLSSYDALGGKTSFILLWTTDRMVKQNPKAYAAVVDALAEATNWINAHKKDAAVTYKRISHTSESVDDLMKMMNDPEIQFTLQSQNVMTTAKFLGDIGQIHNRPKSWKDLFFPNPYLKQGS